MHQKKGNPAKLTIRLHCLIPQKNRWHLMTPNLPSGKPTWLAGKIPILCRTYIFLHGPFPSQLCYLIPEGTCCSCLQDLHSLTTNIQPTGVNSYAPEFPMMVGSWDPYWTFWVSFLNIFGPIFRGEMAVSCREDIHRSLCWGFQWVVNFWKHQYLLRLRRQKKLKTF